MDIHSKGEYPSNALSNFAPHRFEIDGVQCGGMEGFLQSLKFKNVKKQERVCAMSGKEAKNEGKRKIFWKLTRNIWWRGKKIKRNGGEFQALIDRAYSELLKNPDFAKALIDSGNEELTHSIGCRNWRRTVLTEEEFISRLLSLRKKLNGEGV